MAAWGPYVWEWVSILLRWLHVTAAIAWIGASFFFMHLDASLRKMQGMQPGVAGVSWQVHGGGFYEMSKYTLAPAALPDHLIWHKWQAYWTWISGFSLLCWVYYGQSSLFLIDPAVMPLKAWQAAAIGIGALALGWVVYDQLCKSPLAKNDALLALCGFGYVVLTSYGFTLVFSGRGALIHTGALMATIMTANVFFVIMPNQRKSVAALVAGQTPDPKWAKTSKQRSTHNNYITLPVLFMMLSNHYPLTFANRAIIPAMVTCVVIAGAMVRHFYNRWHADGSRRALVGVAGRRVRDLGGVLDRHGRLARHARPAWPRACRGAGRERVARRAARARRRRRRDRYALRRLPFARAGMGRRRRRAQGRHVRHARAHRRAGARDPHAGGHHPRHAAQQSHRHDRRRARRARPLARRRCGRGQLTERSCTKRSRWKPPPGA